MNQALAEKAAQAIHKDEFVTVPETTLPNGLVVPCFLVGKFACSKSNYGAAIVVVDRKPWNNINYHESIEACNAAGFSLITESQILSIAYQITQQPENWISGVVGEGDLYQGIHLGNVYEAQDATYESAEPSERRWHVLANGERVYDFSGNIFTWVFDDVQGDEKGVIAKPFAEDSPTKTTAPYEDRTHGIGDTWLGDDWSGRALVRGGCWGSGVYAGVFDVCGGYPSYRFDFVGFRCTKSL